MTGPEHYREAERLIAAANQRLAGNDAEWLQTPGRRAELRAEAAIHATLSLAAATALCGTDPDGSSYVGDMNAWHRAAGVKPAKTDEVVA